MAEKKPVEVDRNLYLTADKSRIVEEGDPDALYLYAGEGGEIAGDEAARLGYKPRKPKK